MPSIFFDNRSSHGGRLTGWERTAIELSSRLRSLSTNTDTEIYFYEPEAKLARLPILADFAAISKLKSNFNIAHFPSFPPSQLFRGNAKIVYTLFDLTWWKFPETATLMGRKYYKSNAEKYLDGNNFVLTGSETMKNEIINYFGLRPELIFVTKPGVNQCNCNLDLENKEKPFLLFVGTIEPRKNLETLVNAFNISKIAKSHDLIIVGRRGWGNIPLQGARVLNNVSEERLHMLYTNCDAVLQPSLYEGFGLPIIEALAHGKRVICSDIPIFREVAKQHATYVNPQSVDEWKSTLDALELIGMSTRDRVDYANTFNWEKMALDTLSVYKHILESESI
jgi:glycosyltransferase involved in cell wall biosynthesis